MLDAGDFDGRLGRIGLPVPAGGDPVVHASRTGCVDVVDFVDGQAVEFVPRARTEPVAPGQVAVRVELRQPPLAVLVVGCTRSTRGDAYQQLVDGIRVEVHLDRVGPTTDDDVAVVVDDHRAAERVLGAAPGAGPLGVAARVELDEVGVVPGSAGGVVEVHVGVAGVEVQVDVLLEHTGDVGVACGVDVDAVAVAAGAIARVTVLPLW